MLNSLESTSFHIANPINRYEEFRLATSALVAKQAELGNHAKEMGCYEDMQLSQGFFPQLHDPNDAEQLCYANFLLSDAAAILSQIYPGTLPTINDIRENLILLLLSTENPADSNDWRTVETAQNYSDGITTIFGISCSQNLYLNDFEAQYSENLLSMVEELFHLTCMYSLETTPVRSGEIRKKRDEYLLRGSRLDEFKPPVFTLSDSLLEGLAAYLRYQVVYKLVNDSALESQTPEIIKSTLTVLRHNHHNFNYYRNRLLDSNGNPLSDSQINYRARKESYYMYIYGIDLVSSLYSTGWDISQCYELLGDVREKIGAKALEQAKFSLAPNSQYQKLQQRICEQAVGRSA